MTDTLHLGFVCFSSYGGSGVVAAELARGMAGRGHRVHLIASAPPNRVIFDDGPVFLHEVSTIDDPVLDHSPYALAVASKIVEVATEHCLDLVHAHYAVPHATSAYLAKQALGAAAPKVINTLHGTDVTRVGLEPSLQTITRFSVAASDGITVPSKFLRDVAYGDLGIDAAVPIEVIGNFVDTNRFCPPTGRDRARLSRLFSAEDDHHDDDVPVLVHVSNFRPIKRTLDVVEVFARVSAQRPARLLFVGDGPDRNQAAQRVRALGLGHRVSFLGTMRHFADYLRHADVFLFPSESESFGLAALEALSCGVPVVAYRVGGLPEVVQHDKTGLLTEPLNVEKMADAVLGLLARPDQHAAMSAAARADVLDRFSPRPAFERWEAYYRRVLDA